MNQRTWLSLEFIITQKQLNLQVLQPKMCFCLFLHCCPCFGCTFQPLTSGTKSSSKNNGNYINCVRKNYPLTWLQDHIVCLFLLFSCLLFLICSSVVQEKFIISETQTIVLFLYMDYFFSKFHCVQVYLFLCLIQCFITRIH